jgi:hypothetical protein
LGLTLAIGAGLAAAAVGGVHWLGRWLDRSHDRWWQDPAEPRWWRD